MLTVSQFTGFGVHRRGSTVKRGNGTAAILLGTTAQGKRHRTAGATSGIVVGATADGTGRNVVNGAGTAGISIGSTADGTAKVFNLTWNGFYWKMDEASGTRVDASGNSMDLYEDGGTVGNAGGIIGNSARINAGAVPLYRGTNEKISIDNGEPGFNLCGWIRTADFSTQVCIEKADEYSLSIVEVVPGVTYVLRWTVIDNGAVPAFVDFDISALIGDFFFYFVNYTTADATITISVNGGAFVTASMLTVAQGGTNNLVFRSDTGSDIDFDETGIFKAALPSLSEVQNIYNSGAGRPFYQ